MKFKKAIAIVLSLCMIGMFTACSTTKTDTQQSGDSSSANEENSIVSSDKIVFYGVIDPQISAQQIIADKLGYFKDEGLNITCQYLQSGTEISPLIAGGTAKVSCESIYTCIPLAANGVGVKIIAPVADAGDTQCVVASGKSGIKTSADIAGKKIGMSTGAGVQMAIMSMCDDLGVDYDSLEFVNLAPADQISAMEAGNIDIMACWQPWVNNAVAAGGTLLFSGTHSYLEDYSGDVNWMNFFSTIQVTDDFLKNNPKECEAILKAMSKATDYINSNMEDAAGIIADELNLTKDEVYSIMKQNVYSMSYNETFTNACEAMADFMFRVDNIDNVPELSSYTDSTPLKNAVPALVSME